MPHLTTSRAYDKATRTHGWMAHFGGLKAYGDSRSKAIQALDTRLRDVLAPQEPPQSIRTLFPYFGLVLPLRGFLAVIYFQDDRTLAPQTSRRELPIVWQAGPYDTAEKADLALRCHLVRLAGSRHKDFGLGLLDRTLEPNEYEQARCYVAFDLAYLEAKKMKQSDEEARMYALTHQAHFLREVDRCL